MTIYQQNSKESEEIQQDNLLTNTKRSEKMLQDNLLAKF